MTDRQQALRRAVKLVQFMAQYTDRELASSTGEDFRGVRDEARDVFLELALSSAEELRS